MNRRTFLASSAATAIVSALPGGLVGDSNYSIGISEEQIEAFKAIIPPRRFVPAELDWWVFLANDGDKTIRPPSNPPAASPA